MIESKETGTIQVNNLDNVWGIYDFLTKDKYKEALEVFFYEGVSYKEKILLNSITTTEAVIPVVKTVYDTNDPTYEVIVKCTDSNQAEGHFLMGYSYGSLVNEKIYLDVTYILDFAGGNTGEISDVTADAQYIDVISSELIGDRSFKITFKVGEAFSEETSFKLQTNAGYFWNLEQNKITGSGNSRLSITGEPPFMDCSDYVSFLWSVVTNGWILKEKIFDCKSLIENRFENIKFIEKIYSNERYMKYGSYKALLENLETGDILVFNKGNMYHCIIMTDPKTESYAECSGYLETNLGTYYNGKSNPYPFEARFNFLKDGVDVYLCRLYKSI